MAFKDLPEDVMVEILARLPVKSLMRFKRLSKPIFAIITSTYFINKHFKFSSQVSRNQHQHALLTISHQDRRMRPWDPCLVLISSDRTFEAPVGIDLPILPNDPLSVPVVIQGPCNGIFCIYRTYFPTRPGELVLWNPATRETKVLPSPHNERVSNPFEFYFFKYGFGIDPRTKDYKVVSISTSPVIKDGQPHSYVRVYNLSSNSWKTIDSTFSPIDLLSPKFNSYLNGVFYWKGYSRNDKAIICFDMSKEVFWKMRIPVPGDAYREWYIAVMDDCLSFIMRPSKTDSSVEIWTMKEYGDEQTWTMKYKLEVGFELFRGRSYELGVDFELFKHRWQENLFLTEWGPRWLTACYPHIQDEEKEKKLLIYVSIMYQAFTYAESLFPLSALE